MTFLTPYLVGLVAVTCYAALTPLAKKLQLDIPPFAFMGITMGFLCAISLCISFGIEKDFSFLKLNIKTWAGLLGFSIVNLIGFAAYLTAIEKFPATQYQLLYLASPIVAGVLAYILLREPFRLQYLYGLVFIAAGLFIALRGGTN